MVHDTAQRFVHKLNRRLLSHYSKGTKFMNWDIIQGKWNQVKGDIRSQWGKLTDDDLDLIAGKKDKLIGTLQERYGKRRDEAEAELDTWLGQRKDPL